MHEEERNIMKNLMIISITGVCLALCSGCEWTSGGGVDYWDSSGDWVDFSASYKAADNGVVVTKFGTGSGASTTYSTTTNIISGEIIGTGDGSATVFSGNLRHPSISGSLNMDVGGYVFWDSASGSGTASLSVTPADGSSGTINYDTGAWSLAFPAPLVSGVQIVASYSYRIVTTNNPPAEQGNHGSPIYSFVIYQTGNNLQIIDSNGSSYNGTMGSVRVSGSQTTDEAGIPTSGPVEAQFSATGVSQGYNVTIVGILQGTLSGSSLSGRTMNATYMEENGNEANITAYAQ